MIARFAKVVRQFGVVGTLHAVARRLSPSAVPGFDSIATLFDGKLALEIGGPSSVFGRRGLLPVYARIEQIDDCNFAERVLWTGRVADERRVRQRMVAEQSRLDALPDASYDAVLSSHTLEHSTNPLRALQQWRRVLRPEGVLGLFLPHRDGTFDHRRPVTPFAHLLEDLERDTPESDLHHLDEILRLHDLRRDPEAGDLAAFRARSLENAENRTLHQHVFDTATAVELLDWARFELLLVEAARPYHIALVARRNDGWTPDTNRAFRGPSAVFRRRSPFHSDRFAS